MASYQTTIEIATQGQGLYLISKHIEEALEKSGAQSGLINVFIQHTSASLAGIYKNSSTAWFPRGSRGTVI
jgi:thiamine phosphate synthase YjbQ (UPF0047 family)